MTKDNPEKTRLDIERLQVLVDLALVNAPEELIYDRFTQLASKILGAPVSLLSMVAADYQFFKSQVGLPEPWKSQRRTPLSHSFCQHVVATQKPLVIEDAREHDLVKDNLAIRDLGVIGYLGMPMILSDGKPFGSFCAIHSEPHEWEHIEIDIIQELSELVTLEFDMRALVHNRPEKQDQLITLQETLLQILDDIEAITDKEDFLAKLREARRQYQV